MNGMIERRSVREVHNKFLAPLLPPVHITQPYGAGPGGRSVTHPPLAGSPPFQQPFHPPSHNNRRHSADGFHRSQFPQPNFNNRPSMGRGGGRGEGREFHPPAQHGTKRSYDDVAEDDDRRRDSSGGAVAAHLDNSNAPVTPVQPHQPPVQPFSAPARQYVEPKSGDNNDRKMFSYFDVDAPKVRFLVGCLCMYGMYVCTCMYGIIRIECLSYLSTA